MELRDHQKKILDELRGEKQIGLFMGTGTGKTITSLFKHQELGSKKMLIICPPTVVQQWKNEIKAVFKDKHKVLEFPKSYSGKQMAKKIAKTDPNDYDVIILKYGVLPVITDILKKVINYSYTIIADESHRFKSPTTKTYESMMEIANTTDKKIILTATPTEGKEGGYIDYFTQLNFLGVLGPYNDELAFKNRFCFTRKVKFPNVPFKVSVITGYRNIDHLRNIIKGSCRYYEGKRGDFEPSHIKIELPTPKNYGRLFDGDMFDNIVINDPTRLRVAMKTMTSGFVYGRDKDKNVAIQKDNFEKILFLKEFLQDIEGKVVIYYQYNIELSLLEAFLKKTKTNYKVINGKTEDKYKVVNDGDYKVLLGQFKALSESIDGLQKQSNIVVFYTMPESSITYRQAIGRIDRDGQTKVPTYYYLTSKETIDEFIYDQTQSKTNYTTVDLEHYAISQRKKRKREKRQIVTRQYNSEESRG